MTSKQTYIILFICSIFYVLLLSSSTSPLYLPVSLAKLNDIIGNDAAMFEIIGAAWTKHIIPCINIFDHKGPLIFAAYALGWLITGNRAGIYLLQVIGLFASMIYCYKILLLSIPERKSLRLTMLVFLCMEIMYESGGNIDELMMPLLFASAYYAYQWLRMYDNNGNTSVRNYAPIVFGLTLGASLMTRVTCAVSVCTIAVCIAIILIKEKDTKALLKCVTLFTLSAVAVIMPFIIYFYKNNGLSEMWYCLWTHNVLYAENPEKAPLTIWHFFVFCPAWLLAITTATAFIKKKNTTYVSLMITSVVTALFFLTGNGYRHYGMLALPCLALSLGIIFTHKTNISKNIKIFLTICIAIDALGSTAHLSWHLYNLTLTAKRQPTTEEKNIIKMLKPIRENDKATFVAVNCNPNIYYQANKLPAWKYFVLQTIMSSFDPKLRHDMISTLYKCNATYIAFNTQQNDTELLNIIKKRYRMTKQEGNIQLYKLK